MSFPLGVAGLIIGYAMVYVATANLRNGGQGPGLFESLGVKTAVTGPGGVNVTPNQSGQSPQNPIPSPAQIGGMIQL